ncbi:MAG: SH3 domain-containing protein [Caldilineaceae bacterium]|nr:SH3 domain-containing protein [Caldilineaceae bacterium]
MPTPVSSREPAQKSGDPPGNQTASAQEKPARTPRRRSLFWLGFALGFLLLATASCGGLGLALGINQLSLAELRRAGPVWTPPAVTPTPAVVAAPAASSPQGVSTRFAPGQLVRNLTGSRVNIRTTPGYLSKPDGDILGVIQPGDSLEIVGESAAADNLIWWQIRYAAPDGRMIDGWVAEATASGVQILGE